MSPNPANLSQLDTERFAVLLPSKSWLAAGPTPSSVNYCNNGKLRIFPGFRDPNCNRWVWHNHNLDKILIKLIKILKNLGYGLHCYVCNSNQNEACKDPFDEEAAKASNLYKNCDVPSEADPIDPNEQGRRQSKTHYISSESGNNTRIKYSFCRKTVQKGKNKGLEIIG